MREPLEAVNDVVHFAASLSRARHGPQAWPVETLLLHLHFTEAMFDRHSYIGCLQTGSAPLKLSPEAAAVEATKIDWHIAVFCHNEQSRIAQCLASIDKAIGTRRAAVTVFINGSTDQSEDEVRRISRSVGCLVKIVKIPLPDKSNAINAALYDPNKTTTESLNFFIDGYAIIDEMALQRIADRMAEAPEAVAASGVSINGRTEATQGKADLVKGGSLHGQLYALRPSFIAKLVARRYFLPIGLYRGDGLLGSMAAHDVDPLGTPWSDSRLIRVIDASFAIKPLSPFRWRDLRRQFRRKIRQMRGRLENAAIKSIIYQEGYKGLPVFADDMIRDFLSSHPVPKVSWIDRPFMALALMHHRATIRPDLKQCRPSAGLSDPAEP